jgi:hypothetical protein
MCRLTKEDVEEYFDNHLPYRTRILLAHYKMRHTVSGEFVPWTGKQVFLDACFVASLVTARLYLNMLGIGKDGKGTTLKPYTGQRDDVMVDHLGGKLVDISTISEDDQNMLLSFIIMADKAGAHFTVPKPHDRTTIPNVIVMIHGLVKTHLYDATGRSGLETLEQGCVSQSL